jgi:hypothetical protein
MSTSLQTIAAEVHPAGGQFLLEEQTNIENSLIYAGNSKTNSFQNRRTEFKAKVNVSKEVWI